MEAEMNRRSTILLPLLMMTVLLSGCDLIEGILKIGFWSGVIVVLLIVGVIWLVAKVFRR